MLGAQVRLAGGIEARAGGMFGSADRPKRQQIAEAMQQACDSADGGIGVQYRRQPQCE
jgi:hypothetical protein